MSKIEWTDETYNPIVGCSKISEGCQNCYAAAAAKSGRLQQFSQYQKVAPWNGTVEFVEKALYKPFLWREPKKIFTCSMSDLFHENIPNSWRNQVFAVMAIAHRHTFQVLTKRPENVRKYFEANQRAVVKIALDIAEDRRSPISDFDFPPPNMWLGTTVENQAKADERIPMLRETQAVLKFLSCEPLLEPIELDLNGIDWVIVGGESGRGARECKTDWIEGIVEQCKQSNVPVFVKQLGSNSNVKAMQKGGDITKFPRAIALREFP